MPAINPIITAPLALPGNTTNFSELGQFTSSIKSAGNSHEELTFSKKSDAAQDMAYSYYAHKTEDSGSKRLAREVREVAESASGPDNNNAVYDQVIKSRSKQAQICEYAEFIVRVYKSGTTYTKIKLSNEINNMERTVNNKFCVFLKKN